jgi:DNA primase
MSSAVNRQHAQRIIDFQRLKRSVPIAAVLSRYGIELKRSGKNLKGRCPLHHGTSASFVVDENTNLWRCFSPNC